VAEAFGRLKVKEGIPFLTKLLSDNDDETQIRAIHALGQIGTAECLDAIRKKTGNFKGKVKDTAVEVLKKSSPAKDGEGSSPAKQ
jgi:HEAT repeat protein